jgi:type I restriction enzyme S subunit
MMSFKKIGPYIREVDIRNADSKVTLLRGVSTRKVLIESVANMTNVSLHNYKIAEVGQFVYVADTSRRGEKIAIALNDEETCIVSSIYTVFETDEKHLLPEYLFIWFNRAEFDRYARFNSWGSARETFNWDDLCNVEIPIPDIDEQRKYVALYKGLLTNQKVYENSLEDLQLICDTYIEDLIKKEPLKRLGKYIELNETRNRDLKFGVDDVRGVSNTKRFMPTKANNTGRDLEKFYMISPGEFVYNSRTTRMGDKIGLGYNNTSETFLTSWNNTAFRVKRDALDILNPAYLYLFFYRSEFDRYTRFNSWGSSTELFTWADMCDVKLPIPSIEKQEAIVTIYHTLETRKRINEQLKESIKPLCPVLMKGVVEGMEMQTIES